MLLALSMACTNGIFLSVEIGGDEKDCADWEGGLLVRKVIWK